MSTPEKITVWAHVIEHTEEQLSKTDLLLSRLSKRCDDLAFELSGDDPDKKELLFKEATSFLFEIGQTLSFVAESCESKKHFLREYREKQIAEVPQLKIAA